MMHNGRTSETRTNENPRHCWACGCVMGYKA